LVFPSEPASLVLALQMELVTELFEAASLVEVVLSAVVGLLAAEL